MKKYDKEKLNEYAKELFELCIENDLRIDYNPGIGQVTIFTHFKDTSNIIGYSYLKEEYYDLKSRSLVPIWELIEKVKQL